MSKTMKVRCRHCKGINAVNVIEELKKHKVNVYKGHGNKEPDINTPKFIAVTCFNCNKSFKITTI